MHRPSQAITTYTSSWLKLSDREKFPVYTLYMNTEHSIAGTPMYTT